MEYVTLKGRKYEVKKGKLKLSNKSIRDIYEINGLVRLANLKKLDLSSNLISEIKGLEMLIDLKELNLSNNNITEIKGLETLKNLNKLNLDQNKISEIKGLGTLSNLKRLKIDENPIHQAIIEHLGGFNITGIAKYPQDFVQYCYSNIQQERAEKERKEREGKEIFEKIKEMMEVSTRINLDRMQNVLNLDKKTFDNKIFEWARDFNFTIDGDNLIINKATVSDFIDALDKQFASWEKGKEKIE